MIPDVDCGRALTDQHAEPVERGGSNGLTTADERGPLRLAVDHVQNDLLGGEPLRRNRARVAGSHAHGCGVDHEVRLPHRLLGLRVRQRVKRDAGGVRRHPLDQLLRTCEVAVHQSDLRRASQNEGDERPSCCAASAENHDRLAGGIELGVARERLEHPPTVGVVADELAVDAVDGVDGAGHLGGGGNLVTQLEHGGLVRHRDVEPDELKRTNRSDQPPKPDIVGDGERHVDPVQDRARDRQRCASPEKANGSAAIRSPPRAGSIR